MRLARFSYSQAPSTGDSAISAFVIDDFPPDKVVLFFLRDGAPPQQVALDADGVFQITLSSDGS